MNVLHLKDQDADEDYKSFLTGCFGSITLYLGQFLPFTFPNSQFRTPTRAIWGLGHKLDCCSFYQLVFYVLQSLKIFNISFEPAWRRSSSTIKISVLDIPVHCTVHCTRRVHRGVIMARLKKMLTERLQAISVFVSFCLSLYSLTVNLPMSQSSNGEARLRLRRRWRNFSRSFLSCWMP